MKKLNLHWQILIAMGLAVLAGLSSGTDGELLGLRAYDVYEFLGTLFLNALKMLVVPLIAASIISGIAGIGSSGAFGRLGGKTLLYYMTTTFFAVVVGLMVVNAIEPGIIDGEPAKDRIGLSADVSEISKKVEGRDSGDLADIFLRMVPANIVEAAANGEMLGIIFFALVFGFFMTRIGEPYAESLYNFWQGTYEVMMRVTMWVMSFAPIGVFGLVAKVMADVSTENLDDIVQTLGLFVVAVVLGLAIHFAVTMPLLLKFIGRVNPLRHYRAMAPALLTAFSTSSSSATLPLTLECVEKNAGVSNRTSSFVLPLGATVNMDGTALYECVAAVFIAQAYGLDLSFAQQFTVVMLALLTSIGVAGIPSSSMVAITIILAAIGLPAEAIALIWVVDRILDMLRTAVNVFSDSCGAVIIAKLEGEEGILSQPQPRATNA